MDRVANLSTRERSDLFSETAARKGVATRIIEKDFWVCWVLSHLFRIDDLSGHIVFKGGTTLSKIFKAIERFSEDIDLILDWDLLGYGNSGKHNDPEAYRSRTKQEKLNSAIVDDSRTYIKNHILPVLKSDFCQHMNPDAFVLRVQPEDPDSIVFEYPTEEDGSSYIKAEVKLEIGPLAACMPSSTFDIQPYAQDYFPSLFDAPCKVVALQAERTFWEKVTILHQQAHRAMNSPFPARYSRHYYDVFKMLVSPIKDQALKQMSLLHDVIAFKSKYYPCKWAQYDKAVPGSVVLIPKSNHLKELEQDYEGMGMMIFGDAPEFEDIINHLHQFQNDMNVHTDHTIME